MLGSAGERLDLARWAHYLHRSRRKLEECEAFYVRCNQIVRMQDPTVRHIKGKLYHTKGIWPHCGRTINRGGCCGRSAELPQSDST